MRNAVSAHGTTVTCTYRGSQSLQNLVAIFSKILLFLEEVCKANLNNGKNGPNLVYTCTLRYRYHGIAFAKFVLECNNLLVSGL